MKIAVITDLHAGLEPSSTRINNQLATTELPQLLAHIAAHKPQRLFLLGDLLHNVRPDHDEAAYAQILQHLSGWKQAARFCLGNHEARALGSVRVQSLLADSGFQSQLFGREELAGHTIIWLSTQQNGFRSTRQDFLPQEQVAWLAQTVPQLRTPTFVFLHHNLYPQDMSGNYYVETMGGPDTSYISNWQAVAEILEGSSMIRTLFCGHTHQLSVYLKKALPVITLPPASENFFSGKKTENPFLYSIISWSANSLTVKCYSGDYAFASLEL